MKFVKSPAKGVEKPQQPAAGIAKSTFPAFRLGSVTCAVNSTRLPIEKFCTSLHKGHGGEGEPLASQRATSRPPKRVGGGP